MTYLVVGSGTEPGTVTLRTADAQGAGGGEDQVPVAELPHRVARIEAAAATDPVRWAWDTARWYPALLAAGVRVARCHDLRLCHAILRHSALTAGSEIATQGPGPWDAPVAQLPAAPTKGAALFELHDPQPGAAAAADPLAELALQLAAVAGSADPGRVRLLLAGESVGALVAAEMHHDGLPWRPEVHDAYLTRELGPRPRDGTRPELLEALAGQIRELLAAPTLNPDSQPDLLRALRAAGVPVTSTRKWELAEVTHPVVAPLLEYKRLHRLATANGWAWADAWTRDGRFRPDYVPGGVVTGRWASSGGGALQLPTSVRAAARADPGMRLVVADAAQLEPRVLAAMSGDAAMAAAARHADLYQGVVDAGIVTTRQEAKYAMLGAIYGATTGPSAVLMPRLTTAFPRAVALVEDAARTGERGDRVRTWLGRTSPLPGPAWHAAIEAATAQDAGPDAARLARARRRDWGRFTRNFVVQGTAAEWALCWLGALRRRLADLPGRPHLVFFLHDEVVVHAPEAVTEEVVAAVRAAAVEAGRLLFGEPDVDFALSVAVVEGYDQAK